MDAKKSRFSALPLHAAALPLPDVGDAEGSTEPLALGAAVTDGAAVAGDARTGVALAVWGDPVGTGTTEPVAGELPHAATANESTRNGTATLR